MKKILVFTGAGVSAESGVKTFRDHGGLWNGHDVNEVAHINGWRKNPQKVLDFYNQRRAELKNMVPNRAHELISELERKFEVTVITQNVDDLHERAGSNNVIHLHGELLKCRSTGDNTIYDCDHDINIGDCCPDGYQLRPHIVWFGENLDTIDLNRAYNEAKSTDICIVIGTSMQVLPAASIPFCTKDNCIIYYIDPSDVNFTVPSDRKIYFYHIRKTATLGMEEVVKDIETYC